MNNITYRVEWFALQNCFLRPASLEELERIADKLLSEKTVYVDFSRVNIETEEKMLYFLSGVAYAMNGSVTQVLPSKYVFY